MELTKEITKIGNSYGIVIPRMMLEELGLLSKKKKVRLLSQNRQIIIEPAEGREALLTKTANKYLKKYKMDFEKMAR